MAFSSDNVEVFLAVVDHGSFSAAARALHKVPSAVSMAIAQLEAEVRRAGAGSTAMLARLGVELRLVADRAASALQVEVGAFTAGQLGLGTEVTCHVASFGVSDARLESRESGGCCVRRSDGGLEVRRAALVPVNARRERRDPQRKSRPLF